MTAEHRGRFTLWGLLLFGALTAPSMALQSQADPKAGLVGTKAAKVPLQDLAGVKSVYPSPGPEGTKLRVLVFWATWSLHSKRELHRLQELWPTWSKTGVEVLAINVESSTFGEKERKIVREWLAQEKLTLPVALDKDLEAFKSYGLVAVPTTFIISNEDRILKRLSGWPAAGSERLIRSIAVLLGREDAAKGNPTVRSSLPHRRASRLLRMARMLIERKQWDMARYSLVESIKHDPDSVEARILLFDLYKKTGDEKAAASILKKSLALFPRNPQILLQQSAEALASGDIETAKDLVGKAKREDPSYLPSFLLEARIALSQRDVESALRTLAQAMEMNPLHPQAFLDAASIRESQGEKEAAFDLYEKAYRLLRVGL